MRIVTRTAASPLTTVRAGATVLACDPAGSVQVYVATPVGWRVQGTTPRHDGELVVDPWLMALLDAAAAEAT